MSRFQCIFNDFYFLIEITPKEEANLHYFYVDWAWVKKVGITFRKDPDHIMD